MKDVTEWIQKAGQAVLGSSEPKEDKEQTYDFNESNLMKAGLAVAAGLIIAALAKGVKDSDYFD